LCALSESKRLGSNIYGFFRQHIRGEATGRFSTHEILLAIFRMVHESEISLLPLRVVFQCFARRPGAGRWSRKLNLQLQSVRNSWLRNYESSECKKYRRPVSLLARRG